MKRLAVIALLFLGACSHRPPPQPPRPSPSPSPPPPAAVFPLKTAGTKFVDATGKPWLRIGAMECCNAGPTKFEWPMTSTEFIDLVAAHGVNLVHVRIGPITKTEDPSQAPYTKYRAYATHSSGRADLSAWNPAFWAEHDRLAKHALSKGVAYEVDLVDGWEMKEGAMDGVGNPWCLRFSVQPFNECYARQLSRVPHNYALALIDKTVKELGDNPNVIWEISNESGVPGRLVMGGGHEPLNPIAEWEVTLKFELGVVAAVRAAEAKYGYSRRLIGTNSERQKIERDPKIDYVNKHERFATRLVYSRDQYYNATTKRFEERASDPDVPATKPVVVNEWPRIVPDMAVPAGKDPFLFALEQAHARGTYWDLWRGDANQAEFLHRLAIVKQFRQTHQ